MVRNIAVDQYLKKLARGEKAVPVNIDDPTTYDGAHLKNTVLLPLERLSELAPVRVPNKGVQLAVYSCRRDPDEVTLAAERLSQLGYAAVYVCDGTFEEWRLNGAPQEASPVRFSLNFL